MARRTTDLDALAEIVQEVRTIPTPELDWEKIEDRIDALPPPRAVESSSKQSGWFWAGIGTLTAGAAATAVFLIVQRTGVTPEISEQEPMAQLEQRTVDGDALSVGARVTAGASEVSVVHKGRARWILSPNSAATLSAKGEVVALRLESGVVVSHVVRSAKPETFAVEVGGARVSVHGTVFRVERRGERALVDVSEGVVAISEGGVPEARPRFVLRGTSRGDFSLDGRSGNVEGNAERLEELKPSASPQRTQRPNAPQPSASVECEQPPSPAPSAAAEPPPPPLPLQPTIGDIETGVSSTMEALGACFRDHTDAAGGVRVSARTFVTLEINPDGAIRSASYTPPLAPNVELCARQKLGTLNFARSREGVTVKRWMELKR